MPGDLHELYASMWTRMNNDTKQYRSDAALLFNLVLEGLEYCRWTYKDTCWNPLHEPQKRYLKWWPMDLTLFQVAVTKSKYIGIATYPALWPGKESLNTEDLWQDCCKAYDRIPVLSAGLLELSGLLVEPSDCRGLLMRHTDVKVRFIHHTAWEFLENTLEGSEILGFDTSSFEERFKGLVLATLCRGLAFRRSDAQKGARCCISTAQVHIQDVVSSINYMNFMGKIRPESSLHLLKYAGNFTIKMSVYIEA